MFIARVDDTLIKKFNLQVKYECLECNTAYGLWHYDPYPNVTHVKFLCTKHLVSSLLAYFR